MKKNLRKYLKMLKPFDYIILVLLVFISFSPALVFAVKEAAIPEENIRYAIISINGEEVDRFDLDNTEHMTKTYYPSEGQYNIIEIKDGKIRDKEDNSPDQIAVRTGWIERNGQTSICLPHKFIIEIRQEGQEDYYIN
ncbi:NusG domain II-containing protein [Desemzia sp. RIT804]|uniref:NusG domain II-containing protein n=1 Tax=Desemzia sp. RIT 804 TaxID=2810209 RepID=UPI00194FDAC1|nr:NusG domain II-containing protein [Desemzia sp. RIT 804]MBM6614968.1 NusG domain II-containing protein [Desemzia sp. RIT 804]